MDAKGALFSPSQEFAMSQAANDNRVLVSINDVCEMTSLSRTAISKHRYAGNFPIEVVLGERRIGFVRAEVEAWIDARINARRAA
jgi:prophage regulatory protein